MSLVLKIQPQQNPEKEDRNSETFFGSMFIWTFVIVLVCKKTPLMCAKPLCYTLHKLFSYCQFFYVYFTKLNIALIKNSVQLLTVQENIQPTFAICCLIVCNSFCQNVKLTNGITIKVKCYETFQQYCVYNMSGIP